MEEVIKIEGKHALEGTVRISGSKNATVALIPAAILADVYKRQGYGRSASFASAVCGNRQSLSDAASVQRQAE